MIKILNFFSDIDEDAKAVAFAISVILISSGVASAIAMIGYGIMRYLQCA